MHEGKITFEGLALNGLQAHTEGMKTSMVAPGVYRVALGMVNAYLIEAEDGSLTLVDAGTPSDARHILDAAAGLGKSPADIRRIVLTHLHYDHSGSLAELALATGAAVWAHPAEAALLATGSAARPFLPGPGAINHVVVALMSKGGEVRVRPCPGILPLSDRMEIPGSGGLKAVFLPGHTEGHTVFLFPNTGAAHEARPRVLFVGDELFHITRLAWGFVYEDFPKAREALGRICTLDFDVACFGHGRPLAGKAASRINAAFTRS